MGYERGALGLEKDEVKAFEWYKKAAEQNHRASQVQPQKKKKISMLE